MSCGADATFRLCWIGCLWTVLESSLRDFFSLWSMHRDCASARDLDGLGLQSFLGGRGGSGFRV